MLGMECNASFPFPECMCIRVIMYLSFFTVYNPIASIESNTSFPFPGYTFKPTCSFLAVYNRPTENMKSNAGFPFPECTFMGNVVAAGYNRRIFIV